MKKFIFILGLGFCLLFQNNISFAQCSICPAIDRLSAFDIIFASETIASEILTAVDIKKLPKAYN